MYVKFPSDSTHNDDIEILRAYSVLLVLFEHLTSITGSTTAEHVRSVFNGWTGVDLFFCISGFVIYRSLSPYLSHHMRRCDAVRQIVAFWIRRFWRLAPAACLWLAFGIPAILTYRRSEIGTPYDNLADGLAAVLNFENFHRYACNVRQQACGSLYPHYWSLSLEAQFYALLPFGLVLLRRSWLSAGLLLLILLQFPLNRPANSTQIGWFIRTDAIAWGVLLSRLCETRFATLVEPQFLRNPMIRGSLTFGLIFLLGTSQIFWREHFFVGLVGCFAACLVWAASYNKGYIARAFGAGAALRWIGTRSYSLYVCHMVTFKAVRQLCQLVGILDFTLSGKMLYLAAAYAGAFLMAALTHRFVEQPLRRRGRDYARLYLEKTGSLSNQPMDIRKQAAAEQTAG